MSPGAAPMWVLTGGRLASSGRGCTRTCAWPPAPTTASPYAAATTPGSRSAGPTRTTRVLVVSGTRVRPVDGADPVGGPHEAPDGAAGAARRARRPGVVRRDHRAGGWPRPPRTSGSRCAACCRTSPTRTLAGAPLVFHALGLAEWLCVDPLLPALRRPPRAARGRPRAGLRRLRPRPVPAHRPGGDHGRHLGRAGQRGRALPARPPGDLARGPLLDPGRLLRAGRDPRGRRTPRGAARRPASWSARSSTSATSPGRSRPA